MSWSKSYTEAKIQNNYWYKKYIEYIQRKCSIEDGQLAIECADMRNTDPPEIETCSDFWIGRK